MTNTSTERIIEIVSAQKELFRTGKTLDIEYRLTALRALKAALKKWEKPLVDALWADLHKSYEEAYLTELSIVLGEIDNHIRHLKSWAAPKRCATPIKMFPSRSKTISEPLGSSLIIAPWNYPVQLLLNPLVGAIAAGCTAILTAIAVAKAAFLTSTSICLGVTIISEPGVRANSLSSVPAYLPNVLSNNPRAITDAYVTVGTPSASTGT